MSTALQVAQDFKTLYNSLVGAEKLAVVNASNELMRLFQQGSPVGVSGAFKGAWKAQIASNGMSAVVENPTPYAEAVELGSKVGSRPWPHAAKRTVEQGGRVWSSQAVGGVIDTVLIGASGARIVDRMADDIMKGLSW